MRDILQTFNNKYHSLGNPTFNLYHERGYSLNLISLIVLRLDIQQNIFQDILCTVEMGSVVYNT